MKQALFSGLMLLIFAVGAAPAFSQSGQQYSYIFPGTTSDTDLVIANITPQSTSVTVAFYRASGDLASTSLLLAPGKQARMNASSIALAEFTGSVVVTSPVQLAVSANMFSGDTPFDFVHPSEAASQLLIPFAPLDTASISLNLFNPGSEQVEARTVLLRLDGTEQSVIVSTLDPNHSATVPLDTTASVTHLMIQTAGLFRGDRPIAANAVIHNYTPSPSGAVLRTDFAVITATPVAKAASSTILPLFAQGNDYFTIVEVVNLTNHEQTVKVTARGPDGSNISGSNNPASLTIAAYGSSKQAFSDMFTVSGTGLLTGSIAVEGTAALEAAAAIGNISEPSFSVFTGDPFARASFAYQLRRQGREIYTGLAFRNSSDRDANITMSFLADDGTTVSTAPLAVARSQELTGTLADLFPEAQGNGFIVFRSDVGLFSAAIDGRSTNTASGARRPLFASPDFVVPAQQRFLAVGTVRDQTVGVSGVAIRLSGPVESTTLTDGAGTFVFRDIPAGTYQLTPIPISYTVSPAQRTFTIADANSRNNDFAIGLTAATIDSVTPGGVVVGSPATTIVVQGHNFIPTSSVVFEDTEVPTTYVSDSKLTALIDAALLTTSGEAPIRIRNKGPSGTFVESAPATFTVGNPAPTLSTVTGQPSPLIAGTVTAPFTITISGSGFTPATQVKVGGAGRVTTFISATQVRATVLPADVATAGFVQITVQNPGSVESQPFQLQVLYPVPRLTAISPATLTAQVAVDAQAVPIMLTGGGFFRDPNDASITSVALVDYTVVQTDFISSTQLIAYIPASQVASAGVKQIAVSNPRPALVPSDALALFVTNPAPIATSITAGPITYNAALNGETIWLPVIVNGASFSTDSTAWVSLPCDENGFRRAQTTTRTSSTQIVATIPIRCPGTYSLEVRTPQPGGGISGILPLIVPAAN